MRQQSDAKKRQAPKHRHWHSDTVHRALVGFGPGVNRCQTATGVWMCPPCLGKSLNSQRRAGPRQTPSPTLPGGFRVGGRGPAPLSVLPLRVGTTPEQRCFLHLAVPRVMLIAAQHVYGDYSLLINFARSKRSSPKAEAVWRWLPGRPAGGNASWWGHGVINCLILNDCWP